MRKNGYYWIKPEGVNYWVPAEYYNNCWFFSVKGVSHDTAKYSITKTGSEVVNPYSPVVDTGDCYKEDIKDDIIVGTMEHEGGTSFRAVFDELANTGSANVRKETKIKHREPEDVVIKTWDWMRREYPVIGVSIQVSNGFAFTPFMEKMMPEDRIISVNEFGKWRGYLIHENMVKQFLGLTKDRISSVKELEHKDNYVHFWSENDATCALCNNHPYEYPQITNVEESVTCPKCKELLKLAEVIEKRPMEYDDFKKIMPFCLSTESTYGTPGETVYTAVRLSKQFGAVMVYGYKTGEEQFYWLTFEELHKYYVDKDGNKFEVNK